MEKVLERIMADPRLENLTLDQIFSGRQAAAASAASVFALGLELDFMTLPGLGWEGKEIGSLIEWQKRALDALYLLFTEEYAEGVNRGHHLYIVVVAHRNTVAGLLARARRVFPVTGNQGLIEAVRKELGLNKDSYVVLDLSVDYELSELPAINSSGAIVG